MLTLALLLFLIMDPFGNLVMVNSLLKPYPPRARKVIILREISIAALILLLTALTGNVLLQVLGLEQHALSISGGIVLFLLALSMVFPSGRFTDDSPQESLLIVPIAMPLIAGPSAISMVVLFSEQNATFVVCMAILIASAASAALFILSPLLFKFLGERGAIALERLMGIILIMISIQMILDGIDTYISARG